MASSFKRSHQKRQNSAGVVVRQAYQTSALLENMKISSVPEPCPFPNLPPPQKVLLTGATGFLGRHVLYELIKRPIKLACLVRASNISSGTKRLKEVIETMPLSLEKKQKALQSIEVVLPQDLHDKNKLPSFDCLIHTAANVSLSSSFSQSFDDNVGLTQKLYRIAQKNNAHFVHVSTLSVFVSSDFPQTVISPISSLSQTSRLFGNYAATKYLAEAFLFSQKDIPLSVYRLGQLASSLWYSPNHDPIQSIIHATKLSGLPSWFVPNSNDQTDLVSTMEVASILVQHLCSPNVYHLASPKSLSSLQMFEALTKTFPQSLFHRNHWENHKQASRALLRYSNPCMHQKYPYWDVFQSSHHVYENSLINRPAHTVFSHMLQYSATPPYQTL